ncbi:MAG: hypothetical protein V1797_01975, partial [Pseudomonadota bacterium]
GARPAPARPGLHLDAERALLEMALAAPEAARVLAEGGLLDELMDPGLQALGRAVVSLIARGAAPTPDAVAQEADAPECARLVGSLSQCSLCLDPIQAVAQAQSHVELWRRQRAKARRAGLTRAIAAAQARGDLAEAARLLAEKSQINLTSPSSTGKD